MPQVTAQARVPVGQSLPGREIEARSAAFARACTDTGLVSAALGDEA